MQLRDLLHSGQVHPVIDQNILKDIGLVLVFQAMDFGLLEQAGMIRRASEESSSIGAVRQPCAFLELHHHGAVMDCDARKIQKA